MNTFLAGFGLGLSLIVAIGAQNAFILRAGLLRQHVFILCSVCAFSDALLIMECIVGNMEHGNTSNTDTQQSAF